ncbi:hypothetical protein CKM354_001020900 [Cercospora kikuchii]|uniref:Heterokaryon incompatibility domain-containing protein n=1 Tax=Cercospora kikuchii TaxID=84275 RepID=A0A9P3CMA0_9PEZI|nr:uncharacterized protein CKM354_001020900 [Cercospora kikuchii]GIZ47109.1 hypothetical protein CKM354_001020900 [Cercospora kikuchii]
MEPLQEPARQIRLLRLIPAAVDDKISCEMTVHGFDRSTPEYLAISYTWGDTAHPREIFIDNELRMVRQNCHYALWQARYHYPDAYIWIDALCIDQENLEEKSRQVAMMNDEFLWTFSQEFTNRTLRPSHGEAFSFVVIECYSRAGISCEELWDYWEETNSAETLERFLKACDKFMSRPYWERLWILQEVGVAREKEVLCGSFCLSWTVTRNLDLLRDLKKAQALFRISYNTFGLVCHQTPQWNMQEASLILFQNFKCEDARDRIYGTRMFLTFHDLKLHIEPNYSICALELAMEIMRHNSPWTYTSNLLCLLDVNMDHPDFQYLVAKRLQQDVSMDPEVPSRYNMKFSASQLRTDGKGRLTCSLESIYPGHTNLTMLDFITAASNDRTLNEMLSKCVRVYSGDELAFFLGNETREGDHLAQVKGQADLNFVLRPRTGKTFDIVSQGFSVGSHTICWEPWKFANHGIVHKALVDACFATSLSVEDVVVFIGQDLLGCDKDCKLEHDPTARLRRLITPVSSRPGPVAILVDDHWGSDFEREDYPHAGEDEADGDGAADDDDPWISDNGTDASESEGSYTT